MVIGGRKGKIDFILGIAVFEKSFLEIGERATRESGETKDYNASRTVDHSSDDFRGGHGAVEIVSASFETSRTTVEVSVNTKAQGALDETAIFEDVGDIRDGHTFANDNTATLAGVGFFGDEFFSGTINAGSDRGKRAVIDAIDDEAEKTGDYNLTKIS